MGHRAKRKLDDSLFHDAESLVKTAKRQRRYSDSTTLSSSYVSSFDSDDDYGTDTELIAINIDLHKELCKR